VAGTGASLSATGLSINPSLAGVAPQVLSKATWGALKVVKNRYYKIMKVGLACSTSFL